MKRKKEKVADKGVVPQFSFNITFAREEQLQDKKLKKAIDDYHFLTPGTTKHIKSKISSSEEESGLDDVDDGSQHSHESGTVISDYGTPVRPLFAKFSPLFFSYN